MVSTLERARRYIAKCPPAISGQGGHDATFHVAALLVNGFALPEPDALLLLREFNTRCEPTWSERELAHKIASAARAQHSHPRGHLLGDGDARCQMPDRRGDTGYRMLDAGGLGTNGTERTERTTSPGHLIRPAATFSPSDAEKEPAPVNPVAAAERWLKGFRCGEADLIHASAVTLDRDAHFDGAVLARTLFAPGERVNFVTEFAEYTEKSGEVKARPHGVGMTLERDALVARFEQHGSDTSQAGGWLRMNPVDGHGVGDANVADFRFALLESDTLPLDLQLSLFAKLPLPIAAILSSGGRSVHAWVKVEARDATEYRAVVSRMLGLLAKFGVDRKNGNPSRLSRLPGATRVLGKAGDGVQRLLYLNPQPEQRGLL